MIELPSTKDLPEEFQNSTPIKRFFRFAFARDDGVTRVHFGLLGTNNINNYFVVDLSAITSLALEFQSMAGNALAVAPEQEVKGIKVTFDTQMALTQIALRDGCDPTITFSFVTPSGNLFETEIMPELAAELAASLEEVMAGMAQRPPVYRTSFSQAFSAAVPGDDHEGPRTATYFGQKYDTRILQALGVLVIRANLLEKSLVKLLGKLAGISPAKANALFYSTVNMGARIDMIRALAEGLENEHKRGQVYKALERTRAAVGRRNALIHGEWKFKKDKFEVSTYEPNKKQKKVTQVVTARSIEILASDYRLAGLLLRTALS